jgi:dTDP-4-dehydrorhamnose 3,5-epimerase
LIFTPLSVQGAWRVTHERIHDHRGFFARAWCAGEYARQGLNPRVAQASWSQSLTRGTLRGLHFQVAPREEAKTVSCVRGAIFDVIVDVRRGSPTYLQWCGVELTQDDFAAVYVPEGCAHAFLTLADDTVVHYQISEVHDAACYRGARWDDPAFGIRWPFAPTVILDRDASYPDWVP